MPIENRLSEVWIEESTFHGHPMRDPAAIPEAAGGIEISGIAHPVP